MTKEQIQKRINNIIEDLNAGRSVHNADIQWVCSYASNLDGVARYVLGHMERLSDGEFHPRIRLECALRYEAPPEDLRKERKGDKLAY